MKHSYSSLVLNHPYTIKEGSKPYISFTERHLQAIWFLQKYFKDLKTDDGIPITVLSPGLWNAEAGPDFKKAHLQIGKEEVKGDVEVHLSEGGWRHHQHHQDDRYNQVVLHLSLWSSKVKKRLTKKQGEGFYQAHLEPFLTVSLSRMIQLIDLDLLPYKCYSGSGRCSDLLFKKLSIETIQRFFQSAAQWRLANKYSFLQAHAPDRNCYFETGLAITFGYKQNARQFLDIYHVLQKHSHFTEKELFAFSLNMCGFFSPPYLKKWEESVYYRELLRISMSTRSELQPPIVLTLHHIRPLNHPVRRLAYLAKFLTDTTTPELPQKMMRKWNESWEELFENFKERRHFRRVLEKMIPSYEDPFWNQHFTFSAPSLHHKLPLIGNTLKREILVNVFLPILFDKILKKSVPRELEAFENFYRAFPASETSKSHYLRKRFFGDSNKANVLKFADIEQGAYQLHRDFCDHYEASCEGCPFIDRFRNRFLK